HYRHALRVVLKRRLTLSASRGQKTGGFSEYDSKSGGAMTTRRRLSRTIHKAKLSRREDLESNLFNLVEQALKDHDPTVRPASVRAAARLTAVIASQIITQTQAIQRALLTLEEDIPEYGTEFVAQLVREALKDKAKRVGRFTAAPLPRPITTDSMLLADDCAG